MKYTKFYIENFKGIDSVTIDLRNNRIISLVGLNESGKTTVMEAIAMFYSLSKGKKLDITEINKFRPKGIAFTGKIKMQATLEIENEDEIIINKYWKDQKKVKKLKIPKEFKYTYEFEFNLHEHISTKQTWDIDIKTLTATSKLHSSDNIGWNMIVKFIRENIIPEILYYDDFILEIPEIIPFSKDSLIKDSWFYVLDDILKAVNSKLSFKEHVLDIWEKDKVASQRLSHMEAKINEKITKKWGELFGKDKTHFKEIKIDREYLDSELRITFKVISEDNNEFLVSERSKGFKWFFSYLLFTEFRKKRTKNILFLLDEPASNLHSSAQGKILDAISDLSTDSLVIYSTHSHHLIKPDWLAGAYICINENLSEDSLRGDFSIASGAKITAIKYFNYVGLGLGSDKVSYFQPILDALDYKPSLVEPIPNITITEGKYDWYCFKYFSEIIFKEKTTFNFYPGAGRDKLWDIIRLYLAWGKKFTVILDGDIPGIESMKGYEKEFQEHIKGKIFTLENIFKKNLVTEDLIELKDQEIIHDKVFGKNSYQAIKSNAKKLKENLNLAINQLLVLKNEVILSEKTIDNFNKVFSFLKSQTSKVST